jgi:hypothetical protein
MTAHRTDGGPAFPIPARQGAPVHMGMSLRAYLIAHAPRDPQPWFQPDFPELTADASMEARYQWDSDRVRATYVQWPGAWADAQLALCNGGNEAQERINHLTDALYRSYAEMRDLYRTFGPTQRSHHLLPVVEKILRAEGVQL